MASKNFVGLFKRDLIQSFACVYANNYSTQSAAILTLNMSHEYDHDPWKYSWKLPSAYFSGPTGDA